MKSDTEFFLPSCRTNFSNRLCHHDATKKTLPVHCCCY